MTTACTKLTTAGSTLQFSSLARHVAAVTPEKVFSCCLAWALAAKITTFQCNLVGVAGDHHVIDLQG